jgi:hypothetical protein
LHYVAEAGWFWADAVFGGEIAGIVDEVDQNDSPVSGTMAVDMGAVAAGTDPRTRFWHV